MSSITEQFSAATKSQLEAQIQIFNSLANAAVASVEKVIALNLSATKATVEKSSAAVNKLLTTPQEFFSLSGAEAPGFDKLLAYGRELASIASAAQSELIKSTQSSIQQVTELAATPATVTPKTAPVLAAAVSAALNPPQPVSAPAPAIVAKSETQPANEPVAAPVPVPKAAKAPAKPKPAAAPITSAEKPIEVKVAVKPTFPAPPPKPTTKLKSVAAKPKK
ncbi:phasin family protein [Duganella aceris]|uniref:Phasin family protein n=1 Tax=Duganella aceris TaxID=2703883 RepID=A0ABX0FT57_9BURK|nr:phasin family protein [Duganella aceris]NGZ87888.1 phasin family protein [Duganella aceris]